nr:unnamed protein product [Digitaria exilis]
MAAVRRPSPIFLLGYKVDMGEFTDEPEHGWKEIECASKRAYGCGQHGKEAVEGLKLYSRLGDDPLLTSSLAIRMTEEAFQRFDLEIQLTCPLKDLLVHHRMFAGGIIQMADEQGLTVIILTFVRPFCRDLTYYLVYDNTTASLSLIQYVPDLFATVCTSKPVAKRNGSDDFELFVMARELAPVPCRILCACTPETRANQASDGTGPWLIKKHFQHKEFEEPIIAHVAFSLQSKGIWADLSRGLMYCNLDTSDYNEFGFIRLPRECLLDSEEEVVSDGLVKVNRTMSCVGDSIWFVCIDHATEPADAVVKIWTLTGNFQKPRWEKMEEVRVSEIWEFDGFKEARLPKAPLAYPLLTEGGALCVTIADQSKFPRHYQPLVEDDICIFDMSLKRLQWHGFAHNYFFTKHLVIPSDFLQSKHASRKRNRAPGIGVGRE